MTVEEYFANIDEDELHVKADEEENTFFSNGLDLFEKVRERDINDITPAQRDFLDKIDKALAI